MSKKTKYFSPQGGLPPQTEMISDKAIFTESYALIPAGVLSDITTSYLPFWEKTRLWVIARPLSGFAETFSHYIMEVEQGGGSARPDDNLEAQSVLFVAEGHGLLKMNGQDYNLSSGSYAYIPAGMTWSFENNSTAKITFHWIRKRYEAIDGIDRPAEFVTSDDETPAIAMPDTDGKWATTRFVDPADLRHDMHVNIVTFTKGGLIPFDETHVMEHGLYVLQGRGAYHLNNDWYEVQPGDYMWLRAFCPQSCYALGDEPFRYLLYKDVNRHAKLDL